MLQCYTLCGSDSLQNRLLLSPFLTLFNNCWFKKAACVILKQWRIHKARNLLCPGRPVVAVMGMRREQRGCGAAWLMQTPSVVFSPHAPQANPPLLPASLYFFLLLKSRGFLLLNYIFRNSTSSQKQTVTAPIILVFLSSP